MPFGKFRGQPIAAVDTGYLHWLHDNLDQWAPPLREAIISERARRKEVPSADPAPLAAQTRLIMPALTRRSPRREVAPPSAVCARCGLGASADRPLVHASCANDEVPF